ncbi:flavin reductase [Aurantiacibacter xanthus]|uniref:Flavin reductase n=1 Tax=Aurantiacibacter xanthus TaxID=1784712 RepID=A0A3A1P1W9_9SPHN|nr:flavin reductase family protein [Aurantiacibacter xanthus]RIV81978.1 flavin reductase [Aurantiacibacter xanthus]
MSNSKIEPPCPETHRAQFVTQMRRVPGPVAIVSSADGEERTGMAATAWNSLCADPPLMLVCVNRNASVHALIGRTRRFSLNLLAADEAETVAIFSAQRGKEGRDRFEAGKWADSPGGQPFLNGATASFECELLDGHVYETHEIFIGKVRHMDMAETADPMLYFDGAFCRATPLGGS